MIRARRALEWAQARLASRRLVVWAVAAGVILSLPALFGGLQTEDWVFRSLVRSGGLRLPAHINLWQPAIPPEKGFEAGAIHAQMNLGLLPWITSPKFEVSFWRPITSLTHQLDYLVWPDAPLLMHAENLLLYALLIAAAAALYRRLLAPAWAAGLATLLYAVDDAHGHAVGWITNRNALLAALFAALALWAHDRARRNGFRAGVVLSPIFFALGLGSGEMALGIVGYFVAHALFVDRARWHNRLLGALPWLVVGVVWAVAYHELGHGVSGSGLYTDPWTEPAQFWANAAWRSIALLLGMFVTPPSDLWMTLHREQLPWAAGAGGLLLLALAMLVIPLLKKHALARFWALGSVLSLLPVCATFPEDRLLLLSSLGGMALVATFVAEIAAQPRPRLAHAFAVVLVLVHGVAAPVLLPWRVLTMDRYDAHLRVARESAYSLVRSPDQELVLVNAPDFYFAVMLLLTRTALGEPTPARQLCIASTLRDVILHRPDPETLEVLRADGFMQEPFNRLYRSQDERVSRGDKVAFEGLEVQAMRVTERGEPSGVRFRFKTNLDGKKYVWVRWKDGRYVAFSPPEVGTSLVIKG